MWRLLVCNEPTDGAAFQIGEAALQRAMARAATPVALQARYCLTGDAEMAEAIAASDAIFGWNFATGLIASHGARLRLVQSVNAGMDSLAPFDWLPTGAWLCNASGIHARKLQEWACMVLLMLHGRLPFFISEQRQRRWSRLKTPLIGGRTVLVFGTGALGGAVARAARALGLGVLGISRSGAPAADFEDVRPAAEAQALLPQADFVILTLPLTAATRHIADAAFFAAMRHGAGFANVGRGGLVDQDALCQALEAEILSGAVLDVTSPEPPPPDSPLWDAPNLILTPHVSCDDPSSYVDAALDLLLENLARLERGEAPRNAVDIALGY